MNSIQIRESLLSGSRLVISLANIYRTFLLGIAFLILSVFSLKAQNSSFIYFWQNQRVELGDVVEDFSAITFEAWVYYQGDGVWDEITSKNVINSFAINNNSGLAHFNLGNGSSWSGPGVNSVSPIPRNTWTHLAVTWDQTTGTVSWYINGQLDVTGTINITVGNNSSPRAIGDYGGGTSINNAFSGSIDELRIWDYARSAQEIADNYNQSLRGNETGLTAYYRFDEFGGGTLGDAGPNGYNGTLVNLTQSDSDTNDGSNGNWFSGGPTLLPASETNGVNTAHYLLGDLPQRAVKNKILSSNLPSRTGEYTLAFWVRPDGINAYWSNLFHRGNLNQDYPRNPAVFFDPGTTIPNFRWGDQAGANTGFALSALPLNQWTHIAMSIKANDINIYVNGVNSSNYTASNTIDETGDYLYFSDVIYDAPQADFRNAIFANKALDEAAVQHHMNTGDVDLSVGAPATPATALNFDGIDDRVDLGNSPELRMAGGTNLTLEAWINYQPTGGQQLIFTKFIDFQNAYAMDVNATGNVTFAIHPGAWKFVTSNTSLTPGQWYHVAGTYDGENLRVYIDGVEDASVPETGAIPDSPTTNLYLGYVSNNTAFFKGSIDEARVWNVTRSCAEINAAKDVELTGSETGLVAYYNFNNGDAAGNNGGVTNLEDQTAFNHDGALVGFGLSGANSNWIDGSANGVTDGPIGTFPEINLVGNSQNIVDGDSSPEIADDTDLESVTIGNNEAHTFTIENTGTAALNITSIDVSGANASEFVVSNAPSSVAAGSSEIFRVTFSPTVEGLSSATITINNDDCDEATYDYAIQGTGVEPFTIFDEDLGQGFTARYLMDGRENTPVRSNVLSTNMPSGTGEYNLSFWIKPLATDNNWTNVFHHGDADSERNPLVSLYPNSTRLHIRSGKSTNANAGTDPSNQLAIGEWTHVSISASEGSTNVYLNGSLAATDNTSGAVLESTGNFYFSNPWAIASNVVVRNATWSNAALNENEIASLINSGVVVLDDATPPTVVVNPTITVQLGADGTATITPEDIDNGSSDDSEDPVNFSLDQSDFDCDDLLGNSLNFDGDNDNVRLTSPINIGSGNTTVEAWVKVPQIGEGGLSSGERVGVILGNFSSSNNINYEIHANGQIRFFWNNGQVNQYGTQDLRDGKWHHVAFVRISSENRFIGYIDGQEEFNVIKPSSDVTFTSTHRIGGDNRSNPPNFHGNIDELRIWNYARTQVEIQAEMLNPLAGDESGLLNYWNFEEGSGSSLQDLAGGNTGNLDLMDAATDWENGAPNAVRIPVELTVTDDSNNSASATSYVILRDAIAPLITPSTIDLDLSAAGLASVSEADVVSMYSDNCEVVCVELSKTTFTCDDIGSASFELTVVDASNNSTTATIPVQVNDVTAPGAGGGDISALPSAPQLALDNVAEANGYGILYQLDIPTTSGGWTTGNVPYAIDNSASTGLDFDRVAYLMQLDNEWVWVSMDAFTTNLLHLGLPQQGDAARSFVHQQIVNNLSVEASSGTGLASRENVATGNVEIWNYNYGRTNSIGIPNGDVNNYDWADEHSGGSTYSSFQVHDHGAQEVLFAYNQWGRVAVSDLGIGNNTGNTHKDYTFMSNAGNYSVKKLYIMVGNSSEGIATNDITVELGADGTATITPEQIDNGSVDGCGGPVNLSLDIDEFSCNDLGENTVTLTVSDASGNSATRTAKVTLVDTQAPTITLNGGDETITQFDAYTEAGVTAVENCAFDLITTGTVDTNTPGQYVLTYKAVDASSNESAVVSRTVTVQPAVTSTITVISDESGIANDGLLLEANNVGGGAQNLQLNGICFTNSPNAIAGMGNGGGDFCTDCTAGTAFDQLMSTLMFEGSGQPATISFNNLVPGNAHRLQVFLSNDLNATGESMNFQIQGINTPVSGWRPNSVVVSLEFVPRSTTEVLTITANGNRAVVNGYALHDLDQAGVLCNAPAQVVIPGDLVVDTDNSGNATVTFDASASTDDNGIASYEWFVDGLSVGTGETLPNTLAIGNYAAELVITDNFGLVSSEQFTVTVNDATPPLVVTQDITVILDENGNATITGQQVNDESSDNSNGELTFSLDQTEFSCDDLPAPAPASYALSFDGLNSYASAPVDGRNLGGFTVEGNFRISADEFSTIFHWSNGLNGNPAFVSLYYQESSTRLVLNVSGNFFV